MRSALRIAVPAAFGRALAAVAGAAGREERRGAGPEWIAVARAGVRERGEWRRRRSGSAV
ncbi:MAG: hypothetical protein OXI01_06335 [Albidovulum sp.]|nr:hypothetical protein [Albidovulum sp.]